MLGVYSIFLVQLQKKYAFRSCLFYFYKQTISSCTNLFTDGLIMFLCFAVYRECSSSEFKCTHGHRCIPRSDMCDGFFDCPDHSDELPTNCEEKPCPDGHFHCHNNKCIAEILVCNKHDNCGDFSDELSCSEYVCQQWH